MAMLQINIARLAEGLHRYTFSAEAVEIGLAEGFLGSVDVDIDLSRSGRQYLLEASFRAAAGVACDRCLKEFDAKLEGSYTILYLAEPAAVNVGAAGAANREEVQVLPPDAQVITLDEDLRQYVSLSIPGKMLCRDGCMGLCPLCGTNWNESTCSCDNSVPDPRWDALKVLTKKHTGH